MKNSPLNYTDPSGHRPCEDFGGTCLSERQATRKYEDERERVRERAEREGNCQGLECMVNGHTDPPPELGTGEKIGLSLTGLSMVVGFTAAEITLGIIGIGLLDAGPAGVVIDLALIVPAELLLLDVEAGVARYIYDVVSSGTREGHKPEFILIPRVKKILGK